MSPKEFLQIRPELPGRMILIKFSPSGKPRKRFSAFAVASSVGIDCLSFYISSSSRYLKVPVSRIYSIKVLEYPAIAELLNCLAEGGETFRNLAKSLKKIG